MSASCVLPIVNLYSTNKSLGSSSSNIVNNKSNNYEQPFVKIQTSDTCEEEWGDSIWSTNNNQVGEMELKIFNNNYKNTNITGNHILNNNNNKKTRDFHFVSSRIARRHLRQSRSSNQVGHRAPTLNNLLTLSVLTNDSNNNECKSRRCSLSSVCSNWSSAFSTPRKTPRDNQLFGYDMKCLCHPPDNELASNNMHVSGPQILHPSIFEGTNEFPNLFQEVKDALLNGGSIKLAEEGEGGTYFVKEKNGKPIAVFKPFDEEPGACNNPRGNVSPPMIGDIMAGTSWLREIAAHFLDHDSFSGVPETLGVVLPSTLGAFKKDKTGSLQRFVVPKNGEGKMVPAADLTPGKFSVDDVHRIGILDLRLCNCDRHGGNLLAHVNTNETTRLVPIDHGFVLPLTLRDLDFEWLWFPQASVPFSSNSLNYISRLNEDKDVSRLIELGIERKAVNLCKAATITLKMCAKSGWCLRRIGELLRPESLTDESPIETALIKSTKEEDEVDWEEFKIKLATLIQEFPVTK